METIFESLKLLAAALALTIIVELAVAWFFRLRNGKELKTVILINVITNPLMNYLLVVNDNLQLFPNDIPVILVLEILVVISEAFLLHRFLRQGLLRMIVVSTVMNSLSYGIGLLITPSM